MDAIMSTESNIGIKKDLRRVVLTSTCIVLALLTVMMFAPLASQFDEEGSSRGAASYYEIGSLIDANNYQRALQMVDSIIADNSNGLNRFSYFDRFLSEEDYEDASERRAEIYELQWKRIEILKVSGDIENMKRDLKRYSRIIGYHQEEAKAMLNQINE